ncbi:MAG: hypothetical protein ACK55Z_27230, partial [bacterium]
MRHRLYTLIRVPIRTRRFVRLQTAVYEASKLVIGNPAFESCPGVNPRTLFKNPRLEEEAHVGDIFSTMAEVRMPPTVFTKA